jgi:hypothetical protein
MQLSNEWSTEHTDLHYVQSSTNDNLVKYLLRHELCQHLSINVAQELASKFEFAHFVKGRYDSLQAYR